MRRVRSSAVRMPAALSGVDDVHHPPKVLRRNVERQPTGAGLSLGRPAAGQQMAGRRRRLPARRWRPQGDAHRRGLLAGEHRVAGLLGGRRTDGRRSTAEDPREIQRTGGEVEVVEAQDGCNSRQERVRIVANLSVGNAKRTISDRHQERK